MTQQWDTCGSCKAKIEQKRPMFAGYHRNGSEILVGACCADLLVELATPVYRSMHLDISISDDVAIWRYMDFAKFVSMLQSKGIYFSRAARFADRFEGAAGLAKRETEWDEHYLGFFRQAILTAPQPELQTQISEQDVEADANRLLSEIKRAYSGARDLLVSCWNAAECESEALWKIYCTDKFPGVAVRSRVGRLWDALEGEEQAVLGRVNYMDFRQRFAHGDDRIFCKRASLSYEREVRAVLPNNKDNLIEGRFLNCQIDHLIEEIVVSPFSGEWFFDLVEEITKNFGYSIPVRQSEIVAEPFF
jgi:hypothetical protein